MSAIGVPLPLPTMPVAFVAAVGGETRRGCLELLKQKGCGQSVLL
jgi:hypothetical protein